ncbi:MAG TPA: amidohydrolase family protein [Candidatus Dormibacteraeota bacterium]|nr:amidohydrolase family protein [Candidatus Dormibacteraeota bacterium]
MTVNASLIRNVRLIDGLGGQPRADWAVVVEGERIAWMGPDGQAPAFGDGLVVDGSGHSLLPGMINCHVHLCNDGAADLFAQVLNDSVPIATIRSVINARLTLEAGITTVRDCGAASQIAIEIAKAVDQGLIDGPRVRAAGRVVTMTGGHGHFIGREADGPDEVRKAVRAEIKGGAHFIKVMATGGVLTPGVDPSQTTFQLDELQAAVEEAHKAGRPAASHAIGNGGIKNALKAGIDSIEHGFYLDDEAVNLALKNKSFLVPTLIAVDQIVNNGPKGGIPEWVVRKAESESGHHRESFALAVRSGLKIAAGTDAGTPFNPHGDLALELAKMVEFGLPPMLALVAATSNAARLLHMDDQIGSIEKGKLADLILVLGDPLSDIGAMRHPALVMKSGRVVRNQIGRAAEVGAT